MTPQKFLANCIAHHKVKYGTRPMPSNLAGKHFDIHTNGYNIYRTSRASKRYYRQARATNASQTKEVDVGPTIRCP